MDVGGGVAVYGDDAVFLVEFGDVEDGAAAVAFGVGAGVFAVLLGEVEEPGAAGGVDDYVGVGAEGFVGVLGAGFTEDVVGLLVPGGEVV